MLHKLIMLVISVHIQRVIITADLICFIYSDNICQKPTINIIKVINIVFEIHRTETLDTRCHLLLSGLCSVLALSLKTSIYLISNNLANVLASYRYNILVLSISCYSH